MKHAWARELTGWLFAAMIATITTALVVSTARADLLFRDGDSLIVAMLSRSVLAGDGGGWAMSSVLFLPETAVFTALDALLPVDIDGLFVVSAVINLLALYGALRFAAGRAAPGRAPVPWALVALTAFCAIALTEISPSRDALEPASLLLTTTYYSATVIAVVLSVGMLRRVLERDTGGSGLLVALGVVAAVSTLSNPLYAVWATIPLAVVAGVLLVRSSHRARVALPIAVLVTGTVVGFLARIPFAAWITNTGAGYIRPPEWLTSLQYYLTLFSEESSTPQGVVGAVIIVALLVLAVVRSVRARSEAERLIALTAWVTPVLIVLGAVALGTHASRYLQPLAFSTVLVLIARPHAVALPRRLSRLLLAVAGVLLLVGSAFGIPRLVAAAQQPDVGLACVTDWADASGRTGAGQFWTVRLPKLHLQDPSRLVQVDHELNGYAWLVDRDDFAVGEVSYLIEDAQTVAWRMPIAVVPDEVVSCGRYRILDFGDTLLPLGPQHG